MYCNNCGNQLDDSEKFCGRCGSPVVDDAINEAVNNIANESFNNPMMQNSYVQNMPVQNDYNQNMYNTNAYNPNAYNMNTYATNSMPGAVPFLAQKGGIVLMHILHVVLMIGVLFAPMSKTYLYYTDMSGASSIFGAITAFIKEIIEMSKWIGFQDVMEEMTEGVGMVFTCVLIGIIVLFIFGVINEIIAIVRLAGRGIVTDYKASRSTFNSALDFYIIYFVMFIGCMVLIPAMSGMPFGYVVRYISPFAWIILIGYLALLIIIGNQRASIRRYRR